MPDDKGNVTEQERADLSKRRGQAAAHINDPEERRKFIARQGDTEAENKGKLPAIKERMMSQEAGLMGYKKGTKRVEKTGPAMLHKDEAVLAKPDAENYRGMGLAAAAMAHPNAAPRKKADKKVKSVHVRRGAKGGYIAENLHTEPGDYPNEEHVLPNSQSLMAHMQEHMGAEQAEGSQE